MEFFHRNSKNLKALIHQGRNGVYPLFEGEWLQLFQMYLEDCPRKLSGNEKHKAKGLLARLAATARLKQQKVIFSSMNRGEKILVTKAMMAMVEAEILHQKPHLH